MSVWPHSEGRCQPSESRNGDGGRCLRKAGRSGASGRSVNTLGGDGLPDAPTLRLVSLVLSMN